MSNTSISYNEKGVVVLNLKTEKAETLAFVESMPTDQAFKAIKLDVDGRENATRGALSCLVQLLDTPRTDGYKGQGDLNADDVRLPLELKRAGQDAESTFFSSFFKDEKSTKPLDKFLTGIREAGVYATVKGVALKYYYFIGRLPCHYEGDNPQKDKLLSVSAMQKIMASMVDDSQKKDDSFAARIGTIFSEWTDDHDNMTREDLMVLLSRLSVFSKDVQEAVNSLDAQATEHASNLTPPPVETEEMTEEQLIAEVAAHMEAEEMTEEQLIAEVAAHMEAEEKAQADALAASEEAPF